MGTAIKLVWHCETCNRINRASKIGAKAEKKIARKVFCAQCTARKVHNTKVPKGKK